LHIYTALRLCAANKKCSNKRKELIYEFLSNIKSYALNGYAKKENNNKNKNEALRNAVLKSVLKANLCSQNVDIQGENKNTP
jgi:hypothetical protein